MGVLLYLYIMKLLDTIEEILAQPKGLLGRGGYKDAFASKNNPNIIYKVGYKSDLEYEQAVFNEHPDLFCKTYGEVKKLRHPKVAHSSANGAKLHRNDGSVVDYIPSQDEIDEKSYYLAYERLDTNRFEKFYDRISMVFSESDYDFNDVTVEASIAGDKKEAMKVLLSMKPAVKEKAPDLYNDYVQFCLLLFGLINLAVCDYGCDYNVGNFGYDAKGKIKSLDI